MKFNLSIIAAGIIALASCSTGQKMISYIDKIDSLSLALENETRMYENIDSNLIISYISKMDFQMDTLDSLTNISENQKIVAYTYLRKSMKMYLVENPQILEEIEFTKKQLTDLKYDAENKLIGEKEQQLYFEKENESVKALLEKMKMYHQKINSQIRNYELLNPTIDYLIDSLKLN